MGQIVEHRGADREATVGDLVGNEPEKLRGFDSMLFAKIIEKAGLLRF